MGKLKRFLLFAFLFVVVTCLAYTGYVGAKMYLAWEQIQSDTETDSIQDARGEQAKVPRKTNEPFTVLLMGIDDQGAPHMKGRTDVLMVAVVNPETKKVSLLSIPRDTYVTISGTGRKDKINHAHSLYGRETAIATVEDFLDIEIDYYMAVNFDGFRDFINVLGGLKINAEKDMYHHYKKDNIVINIKKGETVLNGDEALYYVRFRKDAEGDFGRNRRQQQVIKAVLDQTLTMRNVTKVGEMIEVIGDNFRTDIPANQLFNMVRHFATLSGDDVESLTLTGTPGTLNNTSYVFVDEAEQKRVQQELKARLNPEPVTHLEQASESQAADQY